MQNFIKIIGAKENNLKNVDLVIPRDKLVVFTGVLFFALNFSISFFKLPFSFWILSFSDLV